MAITANIYDPAPGRRGRLLTSTAARRGQRGRSPTPASPPTPLLYYHFHNGQPATYYTRSNLVAPGTSVLTRPELFDLGRALEAIRDGFDYEPPAGYGYLPMDVEWKLVDDAGTRTIWIKQARPYPGRGAAP